MEIRNTLGEKSMVTRRMIVTPSLYFHCTIEKYFHIFLRTRLYIFHRIFRTLGAFKATFTFHAVCAKSS